MKIHYSKKFVRSYNARIKFNDKLIQRVKERINIFEENPWEPILKLHKLKGNRESWFAFAITGDYRVLLIFEKGVAVFQDIGTHNQVY